MLQQTVGWIALLMPAVVRLAAFFGEGIFTTNSISAYYYTDMRDLFVGSLVAGGLVLAFFRSGDPRDGWSRCDAWAARIAGLAAVGIALFPMDIAAGVLSSPDTANADSERKMVQALRDGVHGPIGYHFAFVAVFFVLCFYLVVFAFRSNTPAQPTQRKLQRNKVYVACGLLMAVAFVWIGVLWLTNRQASIFWPEVVAVVSFSAAWLVKGQLVLRDHARHL
jgi:hypothetical protein